MRRRAMLGRALAGWVAGGPGVALGQGALPGPGLAAGLVDLMPGFWRAYDAAGGGPVVDRARAILRDFLQPSLPAYAGAGVGRIDLAAWLPEIDPVAAELRVWSMGFPAAWAAHAARFAAVFADFAADAPVLQLPSFFNFDAKTRAWNGRVTLFVGPDGFRRFHGAGADPAVLLAHECSHLHQFERNPALLLPGGDPLWLGIWVEGLAVHVSAALNPGASRLQVLLDDPALVAIDAATLRRVAAELPAVLGETAAGVRARYLGYGWRGDIPARSGYRLGERIAAAAARERSLPELLRLPPAEAEALVRRGLAGIAAG